VETPFTRGKNTSEIMRICTCLPSPNGVQACRSKMTVG